MCRLKWPSWGFGSAWGFRRPAVSAAFGFLISVDSGLLSMQNLSITFVGILLSISRKQAYLVFVKRAPNASILYVKSLLSAESTLYRIQKQIHKSFITGPLWPQMSCLKLFTHMWLKCVSLLYPFWRHVGCIYIYIFTWLLPNLISWYRRRMKLPSVNMVSHFLNRH